MRLSNPLKLVCFLGSLAPIYFVIAFMVSYGRRIPLQDQWERSIFLAMHVKNGTLSWADIVSPHNGHRLIFSNLITSLLASVSNWNPKQEMWANLILGVVNFALLIYLIYQQQPRLFYLMLIPVSMLQFSLVSDENWTVGFQTQWHLVVLFFLLALVVIVRAKPGWLPLLAAALFTFGASFSSGNGLVGWVALPPLLWVYGYRRWYYYAAWISLIAAALYLYLQESAITVGTSQATAAGITYSNPILLARFVINFLGAPFSSQRQLFAMLMGISGLMMFNANAYFLYQWRVIPLRDLAVWAVIVLNTGGSAILIGLSRLQGDEDKLWRALVTRFVGISSLFWISLAVLAVLLIWHILQAAERTPRQDQLLSLNIVLAVIGVTLFFQANGWVLQFNMRTYTHWLLEPHHTPLRNEESCLLDYPLYRESDCINLYPFRRAKPELVYMIAAYRLAIFTEETPVNVLPETYQSGSPILIHSPSRWLNVYIREYLLTGIPEADLWHIAPPEEYESVQTFPDPPQKVFDQLSEETLAVLDEAASRADQVWYIRTPETQDASAAFFERMTANGYVATPYPIQNERYRLANFSIFRFQKPPEDTETILSFGEENISLEAWTVFNSRGDSRVALDGTTITAAPCENIRLQSWWQSEAIPTYNYSATAVLIAPDGNLVAQKDASIGETLMQLWQPRQFYFDERLLTIPCDALPGAYALTFGIYLNTGSGFEDLTALDAAGDPLGTRPLITTIEVRP